MLRMPPALIPYLLLLAAVASGALWHLGDIRAQGGVVSISNGEAVVLGGPFNLVDQNGTRRTEKDFLGKYMLVFFGYTYCPDVCPVTLGVMQDAISRLGPRAGKIVPVMISVDPKRDSPEKLKSYLASIGPDFIGLTGTAEEIKAVAKEYRVYIKENPGENGGEYTVDHSGVIYLMAPSGEFLANYSAEDSSDRLAEGLSQRLR